jgi:hypothetical protein
MHDVLSTLGYATKLVLPVCKYYKEYYHIKADISNLTGSYLKSGRNRGKDNEKTLLDRSADATRTLDK